MKTLLKLLFRRQENSNLWLQSYLASYNSPYFQQPGIRYFCRL
jgi:hypothetical protein